jgi:competence protein ComEC
MQLALWAASLALGIAIAVAVTPVALAVLASTLGLGLALLAWRRSWILFVAGLAMACGAALGWKEMAAATGPPAVPEDHWVEVMGQVVLGPDVEQLEASTTDNLDSTPPRQAGRTPRCHVQVSLDRIDGLPASGHLSLVVLGGAASIAPGDWVRFTTRLYVPRGFSNPGLPDARLTARGQGIDFVATVKSVDELRPAPGAMGPLGWARRWAFGLRAAMARAISRRLGEPFAGFVRTMVVGERTDVPERIEDGFRAAGATHVLSVSGLHLAVVMALLFQAAKWLFARWPSLSLRVPARVMASMVSLPACFFYTLLTGEAVATVRSAIMAAMVLGAAIVNRPVCLPAGIAVAAMVLLVDSPLVLLDVSFQLSFASVVGLGLFARWLISDPDLASTTRWQRILRWLRRSFSASVAASLVTMPLVAHHFGEITPAAPLGNLVLVPIVELVVLPCGLVGALLGMVHPWLGAVPLVVAGHASRLALGLAEVFRQFAPVFLVSYPDWLETLLFVAAVGCLLQVAMDRRSRHRRRWLMASGLAAAIATGSLCSRQVARARNGDLRVTFLDVGQGDSALIEGPGGFVAVIDGGGRYDNSFDTGARIVEPVLRARGISRIDLLVLSHAHPDHMNGLFRILARFPTRALWQNGSDGRNPGYEDFMRLARERGVSVGAPASAESHGMTMEALSPWLDGTIGVRPGLDANDASLVVRAAFAGRQILFTGDIGDHGESELLEREGAVPPVHSEVLKVPHHGSRYASSERIIRAVSPTLAVVSAGRFNRFGLPNPVTLGRYAGHGVELLRTDRDGAVTITIDPNGNLTVACASDCPTTRSGN